MKYAKLNPRLIVQLALALLPALALALSNFSSSADASRTRASIARTDQAQPYLVAISSKVITGYVRQVSEQAAPPSDLRLTVIAKDLSNPRGLDHHAPSNRLAVSVSSSSDHPFGLQLVSADGSRTGFARLGNSVKIAAVRDKLGGFTPGELFAGSSETGVIARVSADGSSLDNPWVTLPKETRIVDSLCLDRTGLFNGNLIAVTSQGRVWRVDASRKPTLLASLDTRLEGVTVVPNDSTSYGDWAGKILAGDKQYGGIYTIDARGNSVFYRLAVTPKDIDIIPQHESLFAVDSKQGMIFSASAAQLAGIAGDLVIAQENPGILWRLHWNGKEFEMSRLAQVDQLEQVAFSPAGSCATAISPTSAYFLSAGTEASVDVITPDGCAWTASSNVAWMDITSAPSGTGNDTVTYIVRDNFTGIPRQGTLTIAGQTFTVTQDGGTVDDCVISLSEQFRSFPARSDTGSLSVFTEERCSWQAVSNASWVTITSNCCGIGNGVVTYSVGINPNTTGRAATITVSGKTFSVKQKAHGPPNVNAGPDQTIALPNSASLAGTVTDDGAGGAVSVSWSKVSGPESVIFGNASGPASAAIFSKEGGYVLRLTATDSTGLMASDDVVVTVNPDPVAPPPDPATVAPPINNTVVSTIGSATSFLYSAPNPIQTGVAPGTISMVRAAVLRGRVLDKSGAPLVKAQITVLNHPELGQTFSRADGKFDLAVNGGGLVTLKYEKVGFLPVQRQTNVPWQDYVMIDDVVMMSYDPPVTHIDLSANIPMQVAQGSAMTDSSGTRRATLLFPQGTTATMKLPDSSMQGLTQLHVRATEYTVGANGLAAMPGQLPATSAYTYAVEFSVDEAIAAGATTVLFSQPVINYLDNFLNFPIGIGVPSGSYDTQSGLWIPTLNGLTVKILAINGGQADMDLSGSGQPATGAEYAAVGITTAERQQLAGLFAASQSFWRVPISHFSPQSDYNYPPSDAQRPSQQPAEREKPRDCYNTEKGGSIIECDSQTLGETLNITGTPFTLSYRSSRVPGRLPDLVIPLSGASVPASMLRIELEVMVAGTDFRQTFSTAPNQTYSFSWDGKDAYGRTLQGPQPVTVRIGYVYDNLFYYAAGAFGGFGTNGLGGNPTRRETTFKQEYSTLSPTSWDARGVGLGGWTLDAHHTYDVNSRTLYLGDGSQRGVDSINRVITTVAGGGGPPDGLGDGGQATAAELDFSTNTEGGSIAVAPDGSYYIADADHNRLRRVATSGVITTVAGNGIAGYNGDGIQATLAKLNKPEGVAISQDGSLYIADSLNNRVRKVAPNGIITTVAGNGSAGFSGDGGPATQAQLSTPSAVTVGPDGALYIVDSFNVAVRRVAPDGIITTLVQGSSGRPTKDGMRPTLGEVASPAYVAVGPSGSLYISDAGFPRILRLGTDGIITTVAGGGFSGLGDGGPATQAALFIPTGMAVLADGSFYIADSGHNRIRRVSPDGIINTVAGTGATGFAGDGGLPLQAQFGIIGPQSIALAPDGGLYITDNTNNRVRRIAPTLPGFTGNSFAIPSADGGELYEFDSAGRHLRTINTLTGADIYVFTYDGAGRLAQVTDGDGNITTIQRNGSGVPTSIVGPFGQQTTLALDANGFLSIITDPASQAYSFAYTVAGLMTSETDPRTNSHSFTYDTRGRLTRDDDPASGFKTLSRTVQSQGTTVTFTTALNRTDTYLTQNLSSGDANRINTDPAGLQRHIVEGAGGTDTITSPDGMVGGATRSADPRWGMQAPLQVGNSALTPGGLSLTASVARAVTLSNPSDPLSLVSQNDTFNINGKIYTNDYAAAARTFTFTTPVGRQRTATIDARGRATQSQFANLNPASFTYDAHGRLSTAAFGAGAESRSYSYSYNPQGYLSNVSDPLARVTSYVYDATGRVTQKSLPDGRIINFGYDANGNLTSVTPPGRPAHNFAYTPVDVLSSYTPPNVGAGSNQTLFAHNADRQVTTVTRPDSQTIGLSYDGAGRLSALTIPGGVYGFNYSATTGHLATVSAPGSNTLSFTYDGSLLTRTTWAGTIAGNVSRTFDNIFRVTSQSINSSSTINYTYDNDGLLTGAGSLTLTRDPQSGLVTSTSLGNLTDARSFNGFAEVTSYGAAYNAAGIYSASFSYDKLGRITQKVETIGGNTDTYDYTYDPAGRLTIVKKNNTAIATYVYDSNSNRQSFAGPGGTVNGTYDDQDRLTAYDSTTYAYTANGELLTKTTGAQITTYQYDVLGNLKGVTLPSGTQVDYVVDGENRRIGKTINGIVIQGFLYDELLIPVAELDGSSNLVSRFVYGSRSSVPDYMIKAGITYRIISDHLGSPRLVVDVATGTVAQRIDYDEFGNVLADTNPGFQPFGFAGGLYDRDTGLVRYGARDYDPVSGRWTAKDPILFSGGQANLYNYALNDPINRVDPSGLQESGTVITNVYGDPVEPDLGESIGNVLGDIIEGLKKGRPESQEGDSDSKSRRSSSPDDTPAYRPTYGGRYESPTQYKPSNFNPRPKPKSPVERTMKEFDVDRETACELVTLESVDKALSKARNSSEFKEILEREMKRTGLTRDKIVNYISAAVE
jgi:RHS repeat-associated protein